MTVPLALSIVQVKSFKIFIYKQYLCGSVVISINTQYGIHFITINRSLKKNVSRFSQASVPIIVALESTMHVIKSPLDKEINTTRSRNYTNNTYSLEVMVKLG